MRQVGTIQASIFDPVAEQEIDRGLQASSRLDARCDVLS